MQQIDKEQHSDNVDATLYDRHASIILTYLCRHVSCVQDAEDILLEAFMR